MPGKKTMKPKKRIIIKAPINDEIETAIAEYLAENPEDDKSSLIRRGVLNEIGRPELVDSMRSAGRPAK